MLFSIINQPFLDTLIYGHPHLLLQVLPSISRHIDFLLTAEASMELLFALGAPFANT